MNNGGSPRTGIYGGLMMNDGEEREITIDLGVFHSHGGTPTAGWFISGKIRSRNG